MYFDLLLHGTINVITRGGVTVVRDVDLVVTDLVLRVLISIWVQLGSGARVWMCRCLCSVFDGNSTVRLSFGDGV